MFLVRRSVTHASDVVSLDKRRTNLLNPVLSYDYDVPHELRCRRRSSVVVGRKLIMKGNDLVTLALDPLRV
jgi:hypothetical protein